MSSITIVGAAVESLRTGLYGRLANGAQQVSRLCDPADREDTPHVADAYAELTKTAALLNVAGWLTPAPAVTFHTEADRQMARQVLADELTSVRQWEREAGEREKREKARQWGDQASAIEAALAAIDAAHREQPEGT